MSVRVSCPSCGKQLRIPDHLAGLQTICPACKDAVDVPPADTSPVEEAAGVGKVCGPDLALAQESEEAGLPWYSKLGLLSALMGLLSVPVLCLPVLGYASPALSGLGLLAGLCALAGAWLDGPPTRLLPGGAGPESGFGARAIDLPLAGVAASFVGLVLAMLPLLGR